MMTRNFLRALRWAATFSCALGLIQGAHAQTVRLHGAVALAKTLQANKAAIEAQAGTPIQVVGNGAGRGLADLANGEADIALMAGPLSGVAAAMNKEKPGSVDVAQLKEIPLTSARIAIITHPSSGVKTLSFAQLRDVLTGKASNWKEVGGADQPIKVVVPFGADGTRVTVQSLLFPGEDYAKGAIVRNSAKDLSVVVAQLPGACAVIGKQNVEGNVATVPTEKELLVPWSLVCKGEPSPDLKKVIAATQALIK